MLLTASIIPINSNSTFQFNIANGFSSVCKWGYPSFLRTATLNQIHVINMSKLTNKNTNDTSKTKTSLPLQLTLNTFNTSIHCSIERCAATTHINSTICHRFLWCQLLAGPQNMSPTRTGNPFHDPHGIFNFSNRVTTGFGI